MEDTPTYVTNSLTSPALMVLASTAEASQRANPMDNVVSSAASLPSGIQPNKQGAYNFPVYPQVSETYAHPLFGQIQSSYTGLQVNPSVQLINPEGGGAFRPVTSGGNTGAKDANPSGFLLENTKYTFSENDSDTQIEDQHGTKAGADSSGVLQGSTDGKSITSPPDSMQHNGRSMPDLSSDHQEDQQMTAGEESRNLKRSSRKRNATDGHTCCCPVCGVTLRSREVQSHMAVEVDKLDRLSRCSRKSLPKDVTTPGTSKKVMPGLCSSKRNREGQSTEILSEARYDTYLRIRATRQGRLSVRSKKKKRTSEESATCPVCNEKVAGTPEELNEHVDLCLKKRSLMSEADLVDIEGDEEEYEEYTWAGQTRIRATTLLPGGLAASGFSTASSREEDNDDIDLNVDDDDSEQYGQAQYNEIDLIPCTSDVPSEERERRALRGAYLGAERSSDHTAGTERNLTRWSQSGDDDSVQGDDEISSADCPTGGTSHDLSSTSTSSGRGSTAEVIESLKAKIREQVTQLQKQERPKCLICMEPYQKPLTSIQCWHVHCEECWLRTLGAKKLCPQCNMITSPSDLRKIYL